MNAWIGVLGLAFFTSAGILIGYRSRQIDDHIRTWLAREDSGKPDRPLVFGCHNTWHWTDDDQTSCPTCGYITGEGLPPVTR